MVGATDTIGARMAIPDYQTLMLPLLRLASDGREHRFRDAVEKLASQFGITDVERAELLPSGTAFLFDNRVGWGNGFHPSTVNTSLLEE